MTELKEKIDRVLESYDLDDLTIGVLGGHSALDVCRGAKIKGLKTLVVAMRGREKTYTKYYKSSQKHGVVDEVIVLDHFSDIVSEEVQEQLRKKNTIFIHNRYFWVYCNFEEIESKFIVPIYGSRKMLKLEERHLQPNQYDLLRQANIRIPKIFKNPEDINSLAIVKANEALRGYERAFFYVTNYDDYHRVSKQLIEKGQISEEGLKSATIEEFVLGAQVNFNFFYSPLDESIDFMGTDTRRQTNLDGILRLPADQQLKILEKVKVKMIENGHQAVTIKESLIEKAFSMAEKFVLSSKKFSPPGIIGPFGLQGAVTAEEGKEEIVIFDASLRIPGSPGTIFTPYTGYKYLEHLSYGDRIAMEIVEAVKQNKLKEICT